MINIFIIYKYTFSLHFFIDFIPNFPLQFSIMIMIKLLLRLFIVYLPKYQMNKETIIYHFDLYILHITPTIEL